MFLSVEREVVKMFHQNNQCWIEVYHLNINNMEYIK